MFFRAFGVMLFHAIVAEISCPSLSQAKDGHANISKTATIINFFIGIWVELENNTFTKIRIIYRAANCSGRNSVPPELLQGMELGFYLSEYHVFIRSFLFCAAMV